uniref:Uncharacterized protein n=1 Tax=Phytophthora ramorum TaxID=164328 RepID=H3GV53_PHYRM
MASPLLWVAMASATWLLLSAVSSAALNAKPTTWPALRFNFTLKRSSMNIYGNSDFSMLANPVVSDNGDKVLYDVFATFQQGQTIHNYTLVDGVAFMSRSSLDDSTATPTVSCLDSESDIVPPINSIVTGINEATAMAASGSDATGCTTGSLFEVLINGIDFSLCASRLDDLQLYGDDMNIEVEYLDTQVEILPRDEVSAECKTTVSPSSVTSVGKSLLTGQLLSSSERNLKAEFDFTFWSDDSEDSSQHSESRSGDHPDKHGCSCKSTPRPCIFIHGMGIDKEEPENVDSFLYYWGNLTDHAPCCSSMKFTVLDTESRLENAA